MFSTSGFYIFVGLQHVSSGSVGFLTVLLLVFTSLTQRAFSQGPALYAAQAHKCCSLAPHRIPPLPGLQLRRSVRPHRGTQWGLGGPPCRFWVLPVCQTTLWRMGLKDVTHLSDPRSMFHSVQVKRLTSETLWSIGSWQALTWITYEAFGSFLTYR